MLVSYTYLKTGENIAFRHTMNTVMHAEIGINQFKQPMSLNAVDVLQKVNHCLDVVKLF